MNDSTTDQYILGYINGSLAALAGINDKTNHVHHFKK